MRERERDRDTENALAQRPCELPGWSWELQTAIGVKRWTNHPRPPPKPPANGPRPWIRGEEPLWLLSSEEEAGFDRGAGYHLMICGSCCLQGSRSGECPQEGVQAKNGLEHSMTESCLLQGRSYEPPKSDLSGQWGPFWSPLQAAAWGRPNMGPHWGEPRPPRVLGPVRAPLFVKGHYKQNINFEVCRGVQFQNKNMSHPMCFCITGCRSSFGGMPMFEANRVAPSYKQSPGLRQGASQLPG